MSYEIKLDGMNELRKALMNKANSVNPQAVARVVKQNTAECVTKAKKTVPVRTGALQRSIVASFESGGATGVVSAYMDYAPYVEFGTRFMLDKPYLRPAFDAQVPTFVKDLKKLVKV